MDRTTDREGTLDLPWGAGSKREVNGVVNSGVAMGRGRRDPPPPTAREQDYFGSQSLERHNFRESTLSSDGQSFK